MMLGVTDSLEGKTLPTSAVHQILKWLIILMAYESKLSHQMFLNRVDLSRHMMSVLCRRLKILS